MCFTTLAMSQESVAKKFALSILILLSAAACSPRQKETVSLPPGSPSYLLAKDLSAVLPILAPEKNAVLASAKGFTVTVEEAMEAIRGIAGPMIIQLKTMDSRRLAKVIQNYVFKIGERKLLLRAAAAARVAAAAKDLDQAMAEQYAKAGGRKKFDASLARNRVSHDFVKTTIRDDLTVKAFLERVIYPTVEVSDEDVRAAYSAEKTATFRRIFIPTEGKPETERYQNRKTIEAVWARARGGEDFGELAKLYSQIPDAKKTGGLHVELERKHVEKPLDEAVFSLPVGEVSNILESPFGLNIIKVESRARDPRPLEEIRAEIMDLILQERRQAILRKWTAERMAEEEFMYVPALIAR